jgi:recombination protein RecA
MKRITQTTQVSEQIRRKISTDQTVGMKSTKTYDGNTEKMISTGSTLLDLAISGGRVRGGGLPGGVLVEVFGPNSSGKTILLCEIGGNIQHNGGQLKYYDPEARLNKQFARMFGLKIPDEDYIKPDTIPEVFMSVRDWKPNGSSAIHGICADSLAALSTDQEMENKEGDKMGMRRAKEFSEELRRTCRILAQNNFLMVCSNQVRENLDAGPYGQKYKSPGGEAIGFYSSVRLRTSKPEKLKEKIKFAGKDVVRVIGIETQVEVFKNSVWKPYRTAPLIVNFDYGIDDIQANLQFVKDNTAATQYAINGMILDRSMVESIQIVEENNLTHPLREEVINLWEEIESKFKTERKPRHGAYGTD